MVRKPEPRFDYQYLSGLVSSEAPREVFLLDEQTQAVLSSLAEIVRWDTRWDNADTDDATFIEFRSAIYESLKVPYHFDDLIPLFDDVEVLLASIRDAQCCAPGGSQQTNPADTLTVQPTGLAQDEPPLDTTDSDTWPPDLETDDTGATAFADLAALTDYLCRSAATVFDLLLDMLTIASWFHRLAYGINQLTATWIATLIQKAFPTAQGTLVAFAYEQLYELGSPWAEQLDDTLLDGARSELEAARTGIVCAFANAETWSDAVADVSAILATTLTSSVVYTWLTSGGVIGLVAALLFRGWADPVDNTCECVPGDELEGWVIDNWVADSSEGTVTVTQLDTRKYRYQLTGGAANSKTLFLGPHLISALCPGSTANMPDGTITLYVDIQGTLNTSADAVSEFISWTWGNNCEDEPSTNPNTNTGASFTPNLAIDRQFQITWDYPANVNTAIVRGGLASVHATTFDLTIEITRIVVAYT